MQEEQQEEVKEGKKMILFFIEDKMFSFIPSNNSELSKFRTLEHFFELTLHFSRTLYGVP